MRELKFRAWFKRYKEMEYIDDLYWFEENGVHDFNDESYDFMQYTGLKDKNGKEIYEGDVVKYEDGDLSTSENGQEFDTFLNTGVIEWDCENAQFFVTNRQSIDLETFFEYIDETEVIGNIYENPELLEGENNER